MGALTFAVIEAGADGLGSPRVLVSVIVTVLALAVCVTAQARGKHPMVPLDLFRSRAVVIASGTGFAFIGGFQEMVFTYSLYYRQQRGLSSLATGLAFLPMTLLSGFVSVLAARLAEQLGPRVPIIGGMLLMSTGMTVLALLPASTPVWVLSLVMIPVGICGPLAMAPTTAVLLESVPAHRSGVASGVFNTSRQVGGALAVAVFGGLLAAQDSILHGLRTSLAVTAVMAFLSAAANLFLKPPDSCDEPLPLAPQNKEIGETPMTTWTSSELDRIARADELEMAPLRRDGTLRRPVPIWVVRDGDDLYVRSFRGTNGGWWRTARAGLQGHIRSGGVDKDVTFVEVTDSEINDRVDTAYRTKYGRFGGAYVDPMVAARRTTLKLVPR